MWLDQQFLNKVYQKFWFVIMERNSIRANFKTKPRHMVSEWSLRHRYTTLPKRTWLHRKTSPKCEEDSVEMQRNALLPLRSTPLSATLKSPTVLPNTRMFKTILPVKIHPPNDRHEFIDILLTQHKYRSIHIAGIRKRGQIYFKIKLRMFMTMEKNIESSKSSWFWTNSSFLYYRGMN
jgi:hypothetical protein